MINEKKNLLISVRLRAIGVDSMNGLVDFVKTTIVGGLLLLIPASILMTVIKQAVKLTAKALAPLEKFLPLDISPKRSYRIKPIPCIAVKLKGARRNQERSLLSYGDQGEKYQQ